MGETKSKRTKASKTTPTHELASEDTTSDAETARNREQVGAVLRSDAATATPSKAEVGSSKLVGIVSKIPIVRLTLSKMIPQGVTVEEHLQRLLGNYDDQLARDSSSATGRRINEAMRLASILTTVAGSIARSASDPNIKPIVAAELGRVFRDQLLADLKTEGGTDQRHRQALDLAVALVSDDPIMLYVTGKTRLEDSAWAVRKLADKVNKPHGEMFELLREQFELQIGSHTLSGATRGELGKDSIEEKSDTGEISVKQAGFDLKDLVGEIPASLLTATATMNGDNASWHRGGLDLTATAASTVDGLRKAVVDPNLRAVALSGPELAAEQTRSGTQMTLAQSTHFHRLRQDEVAEKADYEASGKDVETWVRDALKLRYQLSSNAEVDKLITDVVTQIGAAPLTLTQNLDQLFGERADKADQPAWGSAYAPELERARTTKKSSDMLMYDPAKQGVADKDLAMFGVPHKEGMEARGRNYVRWRAEKDERETGFHQLPVAEMPVFGAVNPTFDDTKGGSMNKAERDKDTGFAGGTNFGKNYYGDFHMVLRPALRPRATMIARGKKETVGRRIERLDMTLLFADLIRIGNWDYVDAFVAQAKGFNEKMLTSMDLEIHIYGGVDLATDAQDFYFQPDAFASTEGAAGRARRFADANGINRHSVGRPPTGYQVKTVPMVSKLSSAREMPGNLDLRQNFGTKPPRATTTTTDPT